VLVEDAPVGGISRRQAEVLDSLVDAGVDVQVLGGPRARYRYHHAKYAVVDDRALVLTENWKPSGVGGHSNRGWGVLVDDPEVADELAAVFEADADWRDTVPWESFRDGRSFEPPDPANGNYSSNHPPRNLTADSVSVVVAPDNAEAATVELLRSAEESIRIEQVAIGSRRQPFVRATLDAARRGVEVRVLLSSAWYVRDENRKLVEWLNERADAGNLPLSARLVDPRSRFEKLHAKGVVVDEERVVVGSMNWNNNSARDNREVMVVLAGERVGGYYASVFDADWKRGSTDGFPVGLAVAVVVGLVAARLVAAEKVTFE
jgi:phosphatidylserine/phosphatidylglycerophosphate/cardiolipin synthase-like enzyme